MTLKHRDRQGSDRSDQPTQEELSFHSSWANAYGTLRDRAIALRDRPFSLQKAEGDRASLLLTLSAGYSRIERQHQNLGLIIR